MRLRNPVAIVCLTAVASKAAIASTDSYSFTTIALTSTTPYIHLRALAINNNGQVLFRGTLPDAGGAPYLIHDGTSVTEVPSPYAINTGPGTVNDAGLVAYSPRPNWLYASDGGPPQLHAKSSDSLDFIGEPSINSHGIVAFRGSVNFEHRIFVGPPGNYSDHTPPAAPFWFIDDVDINDAGTVAFVGERRIPAGRTEGVYRIEGGQLTTVVDSTSPVFHGFGGDVSINDDGVIAFSAAFDDDAGYGVFAADGGDLRRIADTSGPFRILQHASINNAGDVVFLGQGSREAGAYGYFTGPDIVRDKVIAVGDTLLGSEVVELGSTARPAINDLGQIAFSAVLADDRIGVFVATPIDPLPFLPGDYNGNGLVEHGDLDLVLVHWGETYAPEIVGWTGDRGNGTVDQDELDRVLANWGVVPMNAAAVPEPHALALLGFLVATWLVRYSTHSSSSGRSGSLSAQLESTIGSPIASSHLLSPECVAPQASLARDRIAR